MKFRTILMAAAAMALIGGASARACDFKPEDAQKDLDKAEFVFMGSVFETQHLPREKNDPMPEYKAMFHADKIFKGRAGGAVNVVQMHDAWGHYIPFNTGKQYLLLTTRNE